MAARRSARIAAWVLAAIVAVAAVAWLVLRVPDIPVATLRAKYGSAASQYVEVIPGLTVHLRDEGKRDGVPLVLLHGSNASLHTWEPWVARLGGRYRIISFDFPAHGLTGPDPHNDYRAATSAGIVAAVADKLKLEHFILAGNSMGGGIAARFAVDHPGRLIGLILVDAGGMPPNGKRDLPLAFRIADTPILRDIVADVTPRWLIANGVHSSVSVQSVMTEPVIDRYWELLRYPGNRAATLARFRQGYGSVGPAELARVDTPSLILWGREDRFIPVAAAAYFAHALPHSRTIIYDGIGHLPMEETPDRSATDIAAFIDAIAKSPVDRIAPDTPPSPPPHPAKG